VRTEKVGIETWQVWVLGAAAVRLVAAACLPVLPEEAYHWCYADRLDFGYYDHPPMIAWMIAAGRLLFGDAAIGIRFVPLLGSVGTTWAVGWIARRFHGPEAARWSVLLLSLSPALTIASSFGFPDAPLLLFWSLAIVLLVKALDTGRGAWWLAVGAATGAALLSKYTAAFLLLSVFLYLLLSPRDRRWLKGPWPYLAALAALAVFSPVLIWNALHDWASFKFQGTERLRDMGVPHIRGVLVFLASQWGAILPFVLPLGVAAVLSGIRRRKHEDVLLLCLSLPMIAFFLVVGSTRATHVFWPLPAYLALTVLMGGALAREESKVVRFYRTSWRWILAVTAVAFLGAAVHSIHPVPWLPALEATYGWDSLAGRASDLRSGLGEGNFVLGVGRRYRCPAQLALHLHSVRGVHAKNLLGDDGLQFAYWADLRSLSGKDAVVVAESTWSPFLDRSLRLAFNQVEAAGAWTVRAGTTTERYVLFVARGFVPERIPRVSSRPLQE
jgi:hypothetical protein